MAPQYGEVRVDYITYTTGVSPNEANVTVPVSGLINNPTFSGNVIIEGNTTIDGDLTVSGSINASGVTISGITGLFDDGTEAAPSIAFASDPDTGIYKPATNEIGISTNASEALRIDDVGNVGIGTSSPRGTIHIGADLQNGATDAAAINIKQTSTTASTGIYLERSVERKGYYIYLGGDQDSLNFQRNNAGTKADVMTLTRDGNVGIGTNAPSDLLTVNGVDQSIMVRTSTAVGTALVKFNADDTNYARVGLENTGLVFRCSNSSTPTERARIDSSGNVGIGTSSPSNKLHVVSSDTTTPGFFQLSDATTTLGNSFSTIHRTGNDGDNRYSLSAWQVQNTIGLTQRAFIGARAVTGAANYNPLMVFGTTTGNGTYDTRMVIDGSGNVGIGTSIPTGKLQIQPENSDIPASALVIRQNNGANTAQNTFSVEIDPLNNVSRLISNSNTLPQMSFWTGISERIRIDESGNVGIGTTNPQTLLDVRKNNAASEGGNISIRNAVSGVGTSVALYLAPNTGGGDDIARAASIQSRQTINGNTADLGFFIANNDTPVEKMTIDLNGNVGIGITNPSQKLTVAGGNILLDATQALRWGTNDASYIGGNDSSSGSTLAYLTFGVNSERMRIDGSGRLLVGLSGVSNGLTGTFVNRTSGTSGTTSLFRGGNWSMFSIGSEPALVFSSNVNTSGIATASETARGGIGFEYVNGSEPTRFVIGTVTASSTPSPVTFWAEGTERMRIDTSGRIGIGTSSPSAPLHVKYADATTTGLVNGLKLQQGNGTNGNRLSL
jgi:hypothetical protein